MTRAEPLPVRPVQLPGNAGKDELDEAMAAFIAEPWDLTKPLWHCRIVEKCVASMSRCVGSSQRSYQDAEGSQSALLMKGHHLNADGKGYVLSQLAITSFKPEFVSFVLLFEPRWNLAASSDKWAARSTPQNTLSRSAFAHPTSTTGSEDSMARSNTLSSTSPSRLSPMAFSPSSGFSMRSSRHSGQQLISLDRHRCTAGRAGGRSTRRRATMDQESRSGSTAFQKCVWHRHSLLFLTARA